MQVSLTPAQVFHPLNRGLTPCDAVSLTPAAHPGSSHRTRSLAHRPCLKGKLGRHVEHVCDEGERHVAGDEGSHVLAGIRLDVDRLEARHRVRHLGLRDEAEDAWLDRVGVKRWGRRGGEFGLGA